MQAAIDGQISQPKVSRRNTNTITASIVFQAHRKLLITLIIALIINPPAL